jgi:hypothetical protein
MIATAHVKITTTDWVRLGEKRIAILAGPVELVENNITAFLSLAQRRCPARSRAGFL